jgi:hypothetical protein
MAEEPTQREHGQQQEPDRDFAEDLDVEQHEAEDIKGGASKKVFDESPKE